MISLFAADIDNDFDYDIATANYNFEDGDIVIFENLKNSVLSGCEYVTGDVNNSGILNGLDVTFGVAYFKGGMSPSYECECTINNVWHVSGDVNSSCSYNGLDVSYLVNFFKGGSVPIPCADCPPIN
jgi:hypothetical protein